VSELKKEEATGTWVTSTNEQFHSLLEISSGGIKQGSWYVWIKCKATL
jgi:hypothetical protein